VLKGLRVLVVEDNAINQKVAVKMLERLGCHPDVAGDGREAVDAVAAIPYDVVLMDCQMPEMDGYTATAEIRQSEGKAKHTCVIAMTANALQGDRDRCIAAGMDDYVSKPVTQPELLAVIRRTVPHLVAADAAGSNNGSGDGEALDIDQKVLEDLRLLAGSEDPEFFENVVKLFLEETTQRIVTIEEKILARDMNALKASAHRMKGSCKQLGVTRMAGTCAALEESAGRDPSSAELNALLEQLQHQFEVVRRELESTFLSEDNVP
jgi:CheY-like chemotaxis protein